MEIILSQYVLEHIEVWAESEDRSQSEIIADLIHRGAADKLVREQLNEVPS